MKIKEIIIAPIRENWPSMLSGLLMGLAFAPFNHIYVIVYLLLIPFIYDITVSGSIKNAAVKGYWFGFFAAISALNWVAFNTISGFISILVIHPWSYILFAIFFYVLWGRLGGYSILPSAVLWVLLELARSWGELRFPWINLYYALSYNLDFIQIAEIGGPLVLSLFIIMVNLLIFFVGLRWYEEKKLRQTPVMLLFILFITWLGISKWGQQRIEYLQQQSFPLLKAGITQPDIDPYQKWRSQLRKVAMERMFNFSDSLAAHQTQLIVWPETAIPTYIRNRPTILNRLHSWVDGHGIPILTGIPDYIRETNRYKYYNAALLVHPGTRDMDVYYKHYLVPGGETIPFKKYLPVLEKIDVGGGDFWPGKEIRTLDEAFKLKSGNYRDGKWLPQAGNGKELVTPIKIIPAICYESVFPELLRKQKKDNDGNLIAVITNDGWYGRTAGPYQHFRASIFRAIETRTSVVRAANNGVSGFIDCCGKVFEKTRLFTHDFRSSFIPIVSLTTIYETEGFNWLFWMALLSLLIVIYREIFHNTIIPAVDNEN